MLQQCESYCVNTLNTMRGLDLISFSIPKLRSSLLYTNSVPMTAILHGTHNISQQTVHEMFCRIQGFFIVSTPLHFGPGTLYKTFEEHPMYKTFIDVSSTIQPDPRTNIRVDCKGDSSGKQATIDKYKERTRIWMFDGVISFVRHPGLDNQHVMLHESRQSWLPCRACGKNSNTTELS